MKALRNDGLDVNKAGRCGSPAARICQVHGRPVSQDDIGDTQDTRPLFIVLRDPVSRAISAFNYLAPRGGFFHYKGREKHTSMGWEMYDCFDHIEELALALEGTSRCSELARGALHETWSSHLGMGLVYYLSGVLPSLLDQSVERRFELVHTESLVEDTRSVRAWAGLPPPGGPFPHDEGGGTVDYPRAHGEWKVVSARARQLLREALAPEYAIMSQLQARVDGSPRREYPWGRPLETKIWS